LAKIDAFLRHLKAPAQAALTAIFSQKIFKKGDFLLKKDETCRKSYWIEAGSARKYYLHNGKEVTTELLFPDDIAVSFSAYALQQPSREYIQAMTEVTARVTDYGSFQELKNQYPELVELDLLLTEYYAIWLEERLVEFHTLSATERYQLLLARQPWIVLQVPLTHIASYLGVSLETLSRIRAKA
jgi:CRP-like cAMP-binding protein